MPRVKKGAVASTKTTTKYKKAPNAPKRFKSAFIIFSAAKHKQIKQNLEEAGRPEKTTDIAKLVSEAWKELNPEEREEWELKAEQDRARYEQEKANYKGPWKIPANKRSQKDPTAPKRPMSAFLAYSNSRRAALKKKNQKATNADLSKMLSKSWKELPQHERETYMDNEAKLRAQYKTDMAEWRKKAAKTKKAERKVAAAAAPSPSPKKARASKADSAPSSGAAGGAAAGNQLQTHPGMQNNLNMEQLSQMNQLGMPGGLGGDGTMQGMGQSGGDQEGMIGSGAGMGMDINQMSQMQQMQQLQQMQQMQQLQRQQQQMGADGMGGGGLFGGGGQPPYGLQGASGLSAGAGGLGAGAGGMGGAGMFNPATTNPYLANMMNQGGYGMQGQGGSGLSALMAGQQYGMPGMAAGGMAAQLQNQGLYGNANLGGGYNMQGYEG